ncbi:MAG: hypothetical protein HYX92_19510 [Chloroflexi bacterium]|nr:hypothetical protein [Chloroflexota bacterium]
MKHSFVLDANIVMRVLTGDSKALNLWTAILRNCHKVMLSTELWHQYQDMLAVKKARIKSGRSAVDSAKLVWELLMHAEKGVWLDLKEQAPGQRKVRHNKDVFLQGMVYNSNSRLVSTDARTRQDLSGLTIEQALELAKET